MKFTAGYLLGASTIVGLGVSFMAGIMTWEFVNEKKAEATRKVSDATVGQMMADLIKNRTSN